MLRAGLILLLLVLIPDSAGAVEAGGLAIYPTGQQTSPTPWLIYNLPPGGTQRSSITVRNTTSTLAEVVLYPVDAKPVPGGGFGMAPALSPSRTVGKWVTLDRQSVTLLPHSQEDVGVVFRVPLNTAIGQHYGGVVVQAAQPHASQRPNLSAIVVNRLGVRIYETVPGKQHPALSLDEFKCDQAFRLCSVVINNRGNTDLSPVGIFQLRSLGRRSNSSIQADSVIQPGEHNKLTVHAPGLASTFPLPYSATIRLNYANQVTHREIFFWSRPEKPFWLIVVLTLCAVSLYRVLLAKK